MEYFSVQADSPREALEKMRMQYGEEARILTHKSIRRGGVFGLFARNAVEITGYLPNKGHQKQAHPGASLEEAKRKILAEAKREQAFQQILKEIQTIKENLGRQGNNGAGQPEALGRIRETMQRNDFTSVFLEEVLSKLRKELSLQDLENYPLLEASVLEWIGEKIRIHPCLRFPEKESKVFAIVGPTGVGKTTTIAKLAAIYGVGRKGGPARKVKITTIDNYRIAARNQIETYAEIMRIPVHFAESAADFKKILALCGDGELVLVDTIGKSPRDLSKLAEMKEILEAAGSRSEIHLAISATTKASDLEDILRHFEPFGYQAVILTKLDETMRIGNIISVLAKAGKPISYIADGQGVPQDIEEASVIRLLMNLDGFRLNRERIEQRFGKREKITEIWS